jgi:HSP20 family molecular chaperone IbpA
MSFSDMIYNSLNNLQNDGDLRGALQNIINSGVGLSMDQKEWHPSIDIVDTNNNLYVYIELPGVIESSIDVDFFNNKLAISGEKLKRYTVASYKNEIVYGKFNRQITLPISVTNKDNVIVKYDNGVLTIIIDKSKEEQNRFHIGLNRGDESV